MFFGKRKNSARFKKAAYPHVELVYNMALRYTGNSNDAEDMTQETLYTAFKNFHQLRDEAKCKSWMLTILRNLFLKEVSRTGRKNEILQDDGDSYLDLLERTPGNSPCPEGEIINKREGENVQAAIAKVPEKYKTPLLLFYLEEMAYREISDVLEIPIGTVMSRISRARKFVKKELISNGDYIDYIEKGKNIPRIDFDKPLESRGGQ